MSEINNNNANETQELIMGKYKDTDALVHAFKELKNSYDGLSQKKNSFSIPDEYNTPDNFSLIDSNIINSSKEKSKKRGYTQLQYENLLSSTIEKENKNKEFKENRIKKYGNNLEMLKSFVNEEFGVDSSIIDKCSEDDIDKLIKYREKSISTNTDIGSNGFTAKVSSADRYKIYQKAQKARSNGDMTSFNFYMKQYSEICNKLNPTN